MADHACYRYEYVVADNVGNVATYTSPDIKVDTTAPAGPAVAFSAFANASSTGSVVYYQPGAAGGSFTATGTASDVFSGIASYAFPALPSGWTWTPGALGVEVYAYSAPNPTAPSGGKTVTASNNAGLTSAASAAFTVVGDSTAPTGGSVTYTNGYVNSTTAPISVSFTPGTDPGGAAGSGVNAASGVLQRASTSLTGATCGTTYSSFATIASNPTSPYSDSHASSGNCYKYQYLISDAVGNQSAPYTSASVAKLDTQAPSQAFSLTSPVNAYFNVATTTLYYNGGSAGSFKLIDALVDPTSGVASATFPAIATTGWTHATETPTTPAGGPFTSASFSWTASPTNPSGYTVTGTDAAGNSGGSAITFVSDTTAPTGGSITSSSGVLNTASVTVAASGTLADSQSGVAGAVIKRDQVALSTPTEACGTFPGTFATTVSLVGGADTSVTTGNCYQYEYVVTDNVGNPEIIPSVSTAKVDLSGPQVTSLVSQESNGTAGAGKLANGTKLIVTFNQPVTVASGTTPIATASENRAGTLSGVLIPQPVTLTIPGITQGALGTGSPDYFSNGCILLCNPEAATFTATPSFSNGNATITLTVSAVVSGGSTLAQSSGAIRFVPAATITDSAGHGAFGTLTTTVTFKLF